MNTEVIKLNVKEAIFELIAENKKERLQDRWYGVDGYLTGEADGYHNALVDLLNRLGIEHGESYE